MGFDAEEANVGGVVVECTSNQKVLEEFNVEACEGDERLAPVVAGCTRYGALSHNHLNQIMKNIAAAAVADIPEVCDGQGKLSVQKLRSGHPAFAKAVEHGLMWEVLSDVIEREEPHALDVIQAALNRKNGAFLLAHEMQAISKLSSVTSALTGVGQRLAWQTVRDKVKETMPQYANDDHFLELYRFVVDLGAQAGPFIADLRSFHDKFVDPKLRKLKTASFGVFNTIPEQFSFVKVAAVKHAYSCHSSRIQHGFCEPFRKQVMKQILSEPDLKDVMRQAEELMSFYHTTCSEVLAALAKAEKTRFLGNLDRDIFTCIIGEYGDKTVGATASQRQADLHLVAGKFYARLASLDKGKTGTALPPPHWQLAAATPPPLKTQQKLESKIIEFDMKGKPLSSQDTSSGQQAEMFEWQKFMRTSNVATSAQQERIKALVFSVLGRIHYDRESAPTSVELDIARGVSSKQPQVLAGKELQVNEVFLIPLVKSMNSITLKGGQPWELAVGVQEGDAAPIAAYIQGSSTLPKLAVASAVAESSQGPRTDHVWKNSDFPWPFWLVQRSNIAEECNCVISTCQTRHVSTFQASAVAESSEKTCKVHTVEVNIPVITNNKVLAKGDELIVYWKKAAKPAQKAKTRTWQDEATQEFRKAQKTVTRA